MAITTRPDLACANTWRHQPAKPSAAVAFVRDHASNGPGWTPRCRSCVASLAAATNCRADVVYLAADQPGTDDDHPDPDLPAAYQL